MTRVAKFIPEVFNFVGSYQDTIAKNWRPTTEDLPYASHVLSFKTVIVRFSIGQAFFQRTSGDEGEVAVFAITNGGKETVGELTTSYRNAEIFKTCQDFFTISWGFSLSHAKVHKRYLPRWTHDGAAVRHTLTASSKNDGVHEDPTCLLGMKTGMIRNHPKLVPLYEEIERLSPGRWLSISKGGRQAAERISHGLDQRAE